MGHDARPIDHYKGCNIWRLWCLNPALAFTCLHGVSFQVVKSKLALIEGRTYFYDILKPVLGKCRIFDRKLNIVNLGQF